MNNDIYNSTDGIVRFISNITNGGVTISKVHFLVGIKSYHIILNQ